MALGAGIELIQPFVNRYGEWEDMAANTCGVLLGTLGGLAILALLKSYGVSDRDN